MRADLRRRSVLAAGAAAVPLLAAGCKGVRVLGTPPKPSREVGVLDEAISAEQVMIARYRSAVNASPSLAGTLRPLLAQHQAHLAALQARLIVPPGAPATTALATTGPAATGSATPEPASPGTPATTLPALAAAEDAAAATFTTLLAAVSPSLAQLLASVAASEASHAVLLRTRRASR